MPVTLTRSSDGLASTVAANVRAELALRRMTARRLAVDIGVTPEWLSRRMRADVPLSVDDLDRIAAALGLAPEALLARRLPAPRTSDRDLPARTHHDAGTPAVGAA